MPLQITLPQSDEDIQSLFPLMSHLRDRIRGETFVSEIRLQQAQGYRLAAGHLDGDAVVLAGFRHAHTLSRGAHLFVDDLVTAPTRRAQGHGTAMLRYLAAYALSQNLPTVYLDSRATAKGFYEQVGFTFLTSIPCWMDARRLADV